MERGSGHYDKGKGEKMIIDEEHIRKNLTVLVTIRNRRNTLPRVMNYYKNFPAHVIFLDSTSSGPYMGSEMASPNAYIYVPGKSYVEKIYDCLKNVSTKYSVVVCDDDFLSQVGLEHSINFLDQNKDYVACRGQEVALFDQFLSYETLDYLVDSLDKFKSNIPKERVQRVWSHFNGANVHNIMRNEVQIRIQEFHLENEQINAISFYDKTLSYVAAVHGNIAVLPIFYIARSSESRAQSLKLSHSANKEISDWKPHLKFGPDFLKYNTESLENLIDVDRGFIEELHDKLVLGRVKEQKFKQLLRQYELDSNEQMRSSPFSFYGYPLIQRFGTGGNLYGHHGWRERFKGKLNLQQLSEVYPIFKKESLDSIDNIIKHVKKWPL